MRPWWQCIYTTVLAPAERTTQALVQQLRSQGKSYGAISKATGKTISTIRRMLGVS